MNDLAGPLEVGLSVELPDGLLSSPPAVRNRIRRGPSRRRALIELGMWMQRHDRVPTVDELRQAFGIGTTTAKRWRRTCAQIRGELLDRPRRSRRTLPQ